MNGKPWPAASFYIRRMPALILLLAIAACGGPEMAIPRATLPETPIEGNRCKVAASVNTPIVTEWPASDKAHLEAQVQDGAVAVAYSGCSMRIVDGCRLPGEYQWQRTTPTTDYMEIKNLDELYAKLPLGAASLEGELERSGNLTVQTTVAGQIRLRSGAPGVAARTPGCERATHMMTGLSVGAFQLRKGGALRAKGSAGVALVEGTAQTSSEKSLVRQAGDPDRCFYATPEAPDPACNSPIQMVLTPLVQSAQTEGPPGTIQVRFFGSSGDSKWEVIAGNRTLCKMPCTQWVDPAAPLLLRERRSWYQRDDRIAVPDLRPYAPAAPLEVRAVGPRQGRLAGGVVLTTFAAMAALTGVSLAGIGCSQDDDGVCRAGTITGIVGAIGLVPGIWMIATSGSYARVQSTTAASVGMSRVPALWSGTF